MENQKPLTSTQVELIRLVMKQASEEDVIREMQGIINRFKTQSPAPKPAIRAAPKGPMGH